MGRCKATKTVLPKPMKKKKNIYINIYIYIYIKKILIFFFLMHSSVHNKIPVTLIIAAYSETTFVFLPILKFANYTQCDL